MWRSQDLLDASMLAHLEVVLLEAELFPRDKEEQVVLLRYINQLFARRRAALFSILVLLVVVVVVRYFHCQPVGV